MSDCVSTTERYAQKMASPIALPASLIDRAGRAMASARNINRRLSGILDTCRPSQPQACDGKIPPGVSENLGELVAGLENELSNIDKLTQEIAHAIGAGRIE